MSAARTTCPICDGRELLPRFHEEAVRDLFDIKTDKMLLSLCAGCGFVFQDPILPSLEGTAHYEEHSSYVSLPSPQMERAKRDQFAWIVRVADTSGFSALRQRDGQPLGLYEIGASVGALLVVARAGGWQVGGLEPSRAAVRVAQESYQLRIEAGDLRALQRIELPVVTMIHVLEHIPDPVAALAHLHRITPETALLTVEVPDFSRPRNTGGTGFFVPEHVSYFTAETLARAARAAGWAIADVHVHEYRDAPEFCMYPVLRGSFLKQSRADLVRQRTMARDLVVSYLDAQAAALRDKVRRFAAAHPSLILFGGGWHTQMLLNVLRPEERAKVALILDSNPQRAGGQIEGVRIESASKLPDHRGRAIVVSSQGYQEQIVEQIRATVGDACPVLTLY